MPDEKRGTAQREASDCLMSSCRLVLAASLFSFCIVLFHTEEEPSMSFSCHPTLSDLFLGPSLPDTTIAFSSQGGLPTECLQDMEFLKGTSNNSRAGQALLRQSNPMDLNCQHEGENPKMIYPGMWVCKTCAMMLKEHPRSCYHRHISMRPPISA